MSQHIAWLGQHFGDAACADGFPLFPDVNGDFVQAVSIVDLVDELATRCDEPLENKLGQRRFGKHSFRSMGAVYLSALGIELLKIQMLARWSSHIITHYTRLAPLKSITTDFKRAILNAEAKRGADTNKKHKQGKDKPHRQKSITGLDKKKIEASLKKELMKTAEELDLLRDMIKRVSRECAPRRFVTNAKSHITHRVAAGFEEAGLKARTLCGWKFARSDVIMSVDPPKERKKTCDTCLPALRATLPSRG